MAARIKGLLFIALVVCCAIGCKKKDFLDGYDKKELFGQPTSAELNKIMNDWQTRDLTPTNYTVLQEEKVAGGQFILKAISFQVNGIKEYAALLVPDIDGKFPVRMMVGGFGYDLTTNSLNMVIDTTVVSNKFIFALPALRGQSLEFTVNGKKYITPISEGRHCDAFDGATDDVLALLNLIKMTEEKADVDRTSVRGGSRGGTVALLAGIRDQRVKRVVCVAGPTDMLSLTEASTNDLTYQCQFLDELVNNTATIATTRQKMIASSPLFFAGHLPLTQLHMGIKDPNVPVIQGYQLSQAIERLGMADRFDLFTYNRAHADIATDNTELNQRIEQFLSQL